MLKIYGHPLSAPTNKVRMCAHAAELDFEFVLIDLAKGEHKEPSFLAINPAGQVPAIDARTQALVDQWCDFVSNLVMPGVGRILFNKLVAPQIGVPVDRAAMEEGAQMLERALPIVETQLGQHAWMAGDAFSIADIALLSTIDPADAIELDLSPYPKLVAWRQDLSAQDFYTRVHKFYGEGATA